MTVIFLSNSHTAHWSTATVDKLVLSLTVLTVQCHVGRRKHGLESLMMIWVLTAWRAFSLLTKQRLHLGPMIICKQWLFPLCFVVVTSINYSSSLLIHRWEDINNCWRTSRSLKIKEWERERFRGTASRTDEPSFIKTTINAWKIVPVWRKICTHHQEEAAESNPYIQVVIYRKWETSLCTLEYKNTRYTQDVQPTGTNTNH